MASSIINCPKFVNHIVYAPSNLDLENSETKINSNMFFAVLDDNSIMFCKPQFDGVKVLDVKTFPPCRIDSDDEDIASPLFWNHWCWINDNTIVAMNSGTNSTKIMLVDLKVTDELCKMKLKKEISFEDVIISIERTSANTAVLQSLNGSLFTLNLDIELPQPLFNLPQPCVKVKSIILDEESFTFGLTERNRFYINTVEIANNVTSFYLHSDFLLMTTLQHTLLTVKLSRLNMEYLTKTKAMTDDHMPEFVLCRKVERGSQ